MAVAFNKRLLQENHTSVVFVWIINTLNFSKFHTVLDLNRVWWNLFSVKLHQEIQICEVKVCEVAQSCPTVCDPTDCSLPGSSIHGIFQARVLEWVAISFSRGSSWPRDRTWVSHTAGRLFTIWATREAYRFVKLFQNEISLKRLYASGW